MDPNVDYYEVLGVSPDSTSTDIKKAYKQMAEAYHPDKVQMLGPKLQQLANEEMKMINEARTVLTDEEERSKYDQARKQKRAPPPPPPGAQKDSSGHMDVSDEILETQSLIWEVKGMDVDITDAENIFQEAKFAFQNKDQERCRNLLKDARASAENARMYKDALELIQKCRAKMSEAAELGADIIKANELYSKTQPAMVNKDYMTVIYYLDLTYKQATKAIENYTYNILMDAKATLKTVKQYGLDPGQVEEVFQQARPLVKQRNYKSAIAVGQQAKSMLAEVLGEYTGYKYQEATAHFNALRLEGKQDLITKLSPHKDKLESYFSSKDYPQALESVRDMYELEAGASLKKEAPKTQPIPQKQDKKDEDEVEVWEYMSDEDDIIEEPSEENQRLSLYERTLYQVWEDGILEEDESIILKNMRNRLNITDAEHAKLETKVKKRLGH